MLRISLPSPGRKPGKEPAVHSWLDSTEVDCPKELEALRQRLEVIGAKTGLIDQLYQITGVDTAVLRGGNLRFMSVARRISRGAGRQTIRIEDIAYCLLGLSIYLSLGLTASVSRRRTPTSDFTRLRETTLGAASLSIVKIHPNARVAHCKTPSSWPRGKSPLS